MVLFRWHVRHRLELSGGRQFFLICCELFWVVADFKTDLRSTPGLDEQRSLAPRKENEIIIPKAPAEVWDLSFEGLLETKEM